MIGVAIAVNGSSIDIKWKYDDVTKDEVLRLLGVFEIAKADLMADFEPTTIVESGDNQDE